MTLVTQLLRDDLEKAVQARAVPQARVLLNEILRKEEYSVESRILASESYRRLSDFHGALRVLHSEELIERDALDSSARLKGKMQLARMLNLLGGSHYALRILRAIPTSSRLVHAEAALGILASNYCYDDAIPLIKDKFSSSITTLGYRERFLRVTVADALYATGQVSHAFNLLEELLRVSAEPLLQAVCHQALGSYQLLEGQMREAKASLAQSEKYFSPNDRTLDRGYLDKWIGALHIQRGDIKQAKHYLNRAWRILFRPGFKPESWLEVMYWFGLIQFKKSAKVPTHWLRILSYPCPSEPRFSKWIKNAAEMPESFCIGTRALVIGPKRNLIDLESKLYSSGTQNRFGLTLPQEMEAWLICAGQSGIPIFRMSETLWPDELFSFGPNLKRLEQLILRARKEERFQISWNDLHLASGGNEDWSCRFSFLPKVKGWRFLVDHPEFSRTTLERTFNLSKRAAAEICKNWVATEAAQGIGGGRSKTYRATISS